MNAKKFEKFAALVGVAPPSGRAFTAMELACRNWQSLHAELAKLEANERSLDVCRQFMHIELKREDGPRYHIMDRLYKRFSNLRREMETGAMAEIVPLPESELEEAMQ